MFSRRSSASYSSSSCRLFGAIECNVYMHMEEKLRVSDQSLVCSIEGNWKCVKAKIRRKNADVKDLRKGW
jgi:hypothetical protein